MNAQDWIIAQEKEAKQNGYYSDFVEKMALSDGATVSVELNADELALVLAVHDNGLKILDQDDIQVLYSVMAKLKEQVWP